MKHAPSASCVRGDRMMQLFTRRFSHLGLGLFLLAPVSCGSETAMARTDSLMPALDTPATLVRGRFDMPDAGGPRFAWPNSALAAHFRGTRLDVRLAETPGSVGGVATNDL